MFVLKRLICSFVCVLFFVNRGRNVLSFYSSMLFTSLPLYLFLPCRARDAMEAAEAQMVADPMDQKALDRLMQAQATFEAVGGMTQDRLVAQVIMIPV